MRRKVQPENPHQAHKTLDKKVAVLEKKQNAQIQHQAGMKPDLPLAIVF